MRTESKFLPTYWKYILHLQINNNIPNVVPKVGSGEGRMYRPYPYLYRWVREVVFDKNLAQNKYNQSRTEEEIKATK